MAKDNGLPMTEILNAPNADIYVIDVSFKALQDTSERDYLNRPLSLSQMRQSTACAPPCRRSSSIRPTSIKRSRTNGGLLENNPLLVRQLPSRLRPPQKKLSSDCARSLHSTAARIGNECYRHEK